jgi:glutamyl-tRNA(Gln) amidotransferase subunit E
MGSEYFEEKVKIGLEIHQQLNTKKLFCSCSSEMSEKNLIYEIRRRLRPVVSELGEFDRAAIFEFFRNREFIYRGYENECCLVDLDEEPPHEINKEALKIALEMAYNLSLYIPDELHIMRKLVLDGSAITSFQRTMLVGIGPADFEKVKIKSLCLEEDAAKLEKEEENIIYYSLSRLGIPLIEISTEPIIATPDEAKEIAKDIGLFLRSFNVKRGIGSIRQDVNISISEARVEIKGWQDLRSLNKLIENEIERQRNLLEIKEIAKKVEKNIIIKKNENCFIIILPGFKEIASKKICKNKRLKDEILEYGKVYYANVLTNLDDNIEEKIFEKFEIGSNDFALLITGKNFEKAFDEILKRIKFLSLGIPEETRKPNEDATTSYSRPLPGSARMYPETDLLPIIPTKKLRKIKTLNEKKRELEKILSKDLVEQIITTKYLDFIEKISCRNENILKIAAITFTSTLKELKRKGLNVENISENIYERIFDLLKKEKISKKSIPEILERILRGEDFDEIINDYKIIPREDLRKIIKDVIEKSKEKDFGRIVSEVMKIVGKRAEGNVVIEEVKKILGEEK